MCEQNTNSHGRAKTVLTREFITGLIEKHPDQYVALIGQSVIAFASSVEELVISAQQTGHTGYDIHYIPKMQSAERVYIISPSFSPSVGEE